MFMIRENHLRLLILFTYNVACQDALFGQTFGVQGTHWSYCYFSHLEFPIPYELASVQSIGAFEFDGLNCQTLLFEKQPTMRFRDTLSICQEGKRVYYLEDDSIHLLYDFGLDMGDTMTIRFPIAFDTSLLQDRPGSPITMDIILDSISSVNVGGVSLNRQYISIPKQIPFVSVGGYITEKLGFEYWILPYFGYEAVDGDGFAGLAKYSDDSISLAFETGCRLSSTVQPSRELLAVYPNPAYDHLNIANDHTQIKNLRLFHSTGALVRHLDFPGNSNPINIESVLPGIYFLQADYGRGHTRISMVVVQ